MYQKPLDSLSIFSCKGVQMRTFHITWLMFFVCFFGWFGLAPLMPAIRADLGLSKAQVGNIIIASVSSTIVARLLIGKLCDSWGPRKTAVRLLLLGSVPVFLVGLARDYSTFLLFRLAIGVIGASFVITQFHTSLMFGARIKGTANAITGGWGNLGGGVTNMVMPVVFASIVAMGFTPHEAWRYAMILPGTMMVGIAFLYHRYTTDTPAGNFSEVGYPGSAGAADPDLGKGFFSALADRRVIVLGLAYAMSFGMEITFDNVASLHFVDTFHLSLAAAGFWAGVFGFMNLFARALGGIFSDRVGHKYGMRGKGILLAAVLSMEGVGLLLFASAPNLALAIACMLFFALFLKMANGATYGIVPFINERKVGLVSGIVGAGGNAGGMLFGFLFRSASISYTRAFGLIALVVLGVALLVWLTRFDRKTVFRGKATGKPLPASQSVHFANEII